MKSFKLGCCALVITGILMTPTQARADCYSDGSCGLAAGSLFTTIYIALGAATIAVVVYGLVTTTNGAVRAASPRYAEMYIRQNGLQLAQDMAAGSGPALADLASAMDVHQDHLAEFGRLMRQNRKDLIPLTDLATLSPDRAVRFFKTMTGLMEKNAALGADYQSFLAHQAALQG